MEASYQVFIVDDDIELSASVVEQIEAAGRLMARSVTTIEAAEHALPASNPGIPPVLFDLRLPDEDGRELCVRLRQNGVAPPMILVSGLDDGAQGSGNGADARVQRPLGGIRVDRQAA